MWELTKNTLQKQDMPTYKNHSAKISSLIQMIIASLKLRKNWIYPINSNRKTTCGMIIQWKRARKMIRIIFIYKVTICSITLKQSKKMIQTLKWLKFQIIIKELMNKFKKIQAIRTMELNLNKNKGSKIQEIAQILIMNNKILPIS